MFFTDAAFMTAHLKDSISSRFFRPLRHYIQGFLMFYCHHHLGHLLPDLPGTIPSIISQSKPL
uniref:Uncharacterized protein n=1 Tax=Arion vulgaris TaxID=1028688 RepID=A0A0B7BVI3_9EUPU